MREILFRGKRVDNGEWVEGFLFQYRGEQVGIGQIKMNTRITHPDGNFGEWEYINVYDLCCPKVLPETVGQYTGLTDKNGTKIFEGDIVKIPDDYEQYGFNAGQIYAVYFAFGGFRLKPKLNKDARGYWLEDDGVVEVIGNIHDNKEPLEGGQ